MISVCLTHKQISRKEDTNHMSISNFKMMNIACCCACPCCGLFDIRINKIRITIAS